MVDATFQFCNLPYKEIFWQKFSPGTLHVYSGVTKDHLTITAADFQNISIQICYIYYHYNKWISVKLIIHQ